MAKTHSHITPLPIKNHRKWSLLLICCAVILSSVFCSTGYVTPESLTQTAQAPVTQMAAFPTAAFATSTYTPAPTSEVVATQPPTATATYAVATAMPTATERVFDVDQPPMLYTAQSGDTLLALSRRFNVLPEEIVSPVDIPPKGLIPLGQVLMIPIRLGSTTSSTKVLPDTEIVYSASMLEFNTALFIDTFGGYFSKNKIYMGAEKGNWKASEALEYFGRQNSINPRLLLALFEYQNNLVLGNPIHEDYLDYPLQMRDIRIKGFFSQLVWAIDTISVGYYQWRTGELTQLTFTDGQTIRIAPELNAGTVAVMYFFSQLYDYQDWQEAMNPTSGFPAKYNAMFGDPWFRAQQIGSIYPPVVGIPDMSLPFFSGRTWTLTGGPHGGWRADGAWAAIDFAAPAEAGSCVPAVDWAIAIADGVLVRKDDGLMVIDLDGDGHEETGWVIVYLHLTDDSGVNEGDWIYKGDVLGHPSCEGGSSTGSHLHIARKYNGEWVAADGPLPFTLNGWVAHNGDKPYLGSLQRGNDIITASNVSAGYSKIFNDESY